MKYLEYQALEAVQQRSRNEWLDILGHPKHPGDVSEFYWGWVTHPLYATVLMQVGDGTENRLTPGERNALMDETDPRVVEFFATMPVKPE